MKISALLAASTAVLFIAGIANAQVAPVAGDIAVTEIMFNPGPDACVTDANGEYFEIMNISCKALDLNGLYFEDRNTTTGLPSGFGFQVLASVATLPTLYPGQFFIFARSGNSLVNGGIPTVHYVYASTSTTPPVDKSQVGSTQMMFNNTNVDGLFIATGNFASLGGTVIESVSYNASVTPLTPNSGISAERIDPYTAWAVSGTGGTTNNNCIQSTVTFGPCSPSQKGTPGARGATTVTMWPSNSIYDSVSFPNTGILTGPEPVSVGVGNVSFEAQGGINLAGQFFSFGYADNNPFEFPFSFFIAGNPGSIVIDLGTAAYLDDPSYQFDINGNCTFSVGVPNNPLIIGLTFQLQWLSFDPNAFQLIGSNGLYVLACP
jgi:hypothetical protein